MVVEQIYARGKIADLGVDMPDEDIKQLLEEHLIAINENTAEIQAMFDYLQEIEHKVERLAQRVDQLQLVTEKQAMPLALTHLEKKVFLALYVEETPLCYQEIAVKTNLPVSLIPECISSLVAKCIPLQRSFYNEKLFLKLDPKFKEMQAKENVVNLSLQSFLV